MTNVIAVLIDIVGSRNLPDRSAAQKEILNCFRDAERSIAQHLESVRSNNNLSTDWPPKEPYQSLEWTIGDEFQAVYRSPKEALLVAHIARLTLRDPVDVRFGFGLGELVKTGDESEIQDGSAWWNARDAINTAHRLQNTGNSSLHAWFNCAQQPKITSEVNAYLLLHQHVVGRLKARERRLTAGVFLGKTQSTLATEEGISQSAVSQTLQRCGGLQLNESLKSLREDSFL